MTKIISCLTEALSGRHWIDWAVAVLPEGQGCTNRSSLVVCSTDPGRPGAEQQQCSLDVTPAFPHRVLHSITRVVSLHSLP